ncbi:unnamed protein product [Brachionus calyciflorus]|uniref:Uncharacterized protein n=1 Tax=Brachionus calyciflorus TaxID=104777 RepID=A0A814GV78_9BILA|nr:unnamed protein product [Brachionus calyciflorus]
MASYFDEHDCEPLGENETPNEQLLLARLLVDSGIAHALQLSYPNLMNQNLAPPISKKWLRDEFPKYCFNESEKTGHKCPICLLQFENESQNESKCIKLPDCELPSDDPYYEEYKRQKKREKIRQQDLEDLHNSMFS